MPEEIDNINSEVRTKTLYRNIAYTGWILFVGLMLLWVLDAISDRAIYGLIISGILGSIFTVLMAKKKIPGEVQSD